MNASKVTENRINLSKPYPKMAWVPLDDSPCCIRYGGTSCACTDDNDRRPFCRSGNATISSVEHKKIGFFPFNFHSFISHFFLRFYRPKVPAQNPSSDQNTLRSVGLADGLYRHIVYDFSLNDRATCRSSVATDRKKKPSTRHKYFIVKSIDYFVRQYRVPKRRIVFHDGNCVRLMWFSGN